MKTKIKEIIGRTDDIIFRYPMVITMALIAAISAVVAIEIDHQTNQFMVTKLAFTGCLGISVMFGIKMLSQRIGKGFLLEILGTAFLFWFFFYLPETEKNFTEIHGYVMASMVILTHLFVSFAGFINKTPETHFWQYNKNLFINIFLTAVFTGVLLIGIELAILAVDKLFDFNFNDTLYPKTFFFLGILGSAFIFLIFNNKGLFELEKDGNYPQILKFFTQFVLIPLLLIYVVILYFYSGKILLHWELPRGWVSYLVLIYSVVGILALLLVHPLKEDSAKSWVKIFSKIFYYTLLPLLILLFVAIFTRILEYGYTEPRYFVLLLAIWLTSVVFYFIFLRKSTIKFIPISLFVFGVFALLFPYCNAFSVAKRSQKIELQQILAQNKLLENGKINFEKAIEDSTAIEIANKFEFLNKRKQSDFLLNYISAKETPRFRKILKEKNYTTFVEVRSKFKNIKYNKATSKDDKLFTRLNIFVRNFNYDISNYQQLFKIENYNSNEFEFDGKTFNINGFNNNLTLRYNNQTIDLSPEINKIIAQYKNRKDEVVVDEISFIKRIDHYELKFLIDELNYNKYNGDKGTYYINRDLIVLIKKN